ncbi:polyamine aminopropyltransferase [Chitinimonas sp.]|uniref:spermine/spermidine synthase domain-containing protein n=1 Tax=Chitinimonas sp. TaxID=1934313 RepID=UPI002F948558
MPDPAENFVDHLLLRCKPIGKPFVYEEAGTISLHFDIEATQSLMRLDDPYQLSLGYTRTMMGFLLLTDIPQSMVMIGLGGGSLPKFCFRHLPETDITVVEINPEVIALRQQFHIPDDDMRFRVVCEDGADYVCRQDASVDVLLVDGFDHEGQCPELAAPSFYQGCHDALRVGGVMVVNLLGSDLLREVYIARIQRVFGNLVLIVDAERGANVVVFAIKADKPRLGKARLAKRAQVMASRCGISFQHVLAGLHRQLWPLDEIPQPAPAQPGAGC